jgi:histidine ammonia-lyase
LRAGKGTSVAYKVVREFIPTLQHDRLLKNDIEKIKNLVELNVIVNRVEAAIGSL